MTLKSLSQFGKSFQHKVLCVLLEDREFLLEVNESLKSSYFELDAQKWIVDLILRYFEEYHTTLSKEAIKIEVEKIENDILKLAIQHELVNSLEVSKEDTDYVKKEFKNFCRNQAMKEAILHSAELLKMDDFDGIRNSIEKAMKASTDVNIGHEYEKDVETRYRPDTRNAVPFPWPEMNALMKGGAGAGDLVILFGSPGSGKSWNCIAIAAHAALQGKNVIYYTLELTEDYVGKRFDSYITGVPMADIEDHRDQVEEAIKKVKGKVVIKEYPPKFASISTIKTHIQRCSDEGFPPDIVIVDYVDYLRSPSKYKTVEKKDEIDDNYIATKGLAKELKIPFITPSQVNRAGAQDDIIEGDKAAGSYDKIMIADIIITSSRKREDALRNAARWFIQKNRFGRDKIAYEVSMNTDNGRSEILSEYEPGRSDGANDALSEIQRGFFNNS